MTTILEPLLQPVLTLEEWQTTKKAATASIYKTWWEEAAQKTGYYNEEQAREIVRLGVLAEEKAIAVTVGNIIARNWGNGSRDVEALEICQEILQLGKDYRILGTIARAEETLGLVEDAMTHYQTALELCPEDDIKEKATTLHNMASLKAQQGDIEDAIALSNQSLQISESINDVRGKADTLHEMAGLIAKQGDIENAIALYNQSLDIREFINDVRGKADTLHEMAGLIAKQGDIENAIALYNQSLQIFKSINDLQGLLVTSSNVGYLAGKIGNIVRELELYLQVADILGKIRDYTNLHTVLNNLGIADESKRIIYFAQAVWLCLRVQIPLTATLETFEAMYNRVPQGDEMEALLGASALYLCQLRGSEHPQFEELQQRSIEIFASALEAQGIEPEAFPTWSEQQQLNNSSYFIPRLIERLEEIVGDEWLFERF